MIKSRLGIFKLTCLFTRRARPSCKMMIRGMLSPMNSSLGASALGSGTGCVVILQEFESACMCGCNQNPPNVTDASTHRSVVGMHENIYEISRQKKISTQSPDGKIKAYTGA